MLRIALTGGLATGKSYVARRMRKAGVPVVDADVLSREVVAPGTPGLAAIRARFGASVMQDDGTLDRAALAAVVFADAEARQALEAIVHPAVRQGIDAFFADLPRDTVFAVADIPLLYETGRETDFDRVIVAACSRSAQIARAMARDGATLIDVEQRLAAQWPIDDKVARADYAIDTEGSYDATNAAVDALISKLHGA